jgi:hypothetical protein
MFILNGIAAQMANQRHWEPDGVVITGDFRLPDDALVGRLLELMGHPTSTHFYAFVNRHRPGDEVHPHVDGDEGDMPICSYVFGLSVGFTGAVLVASNNANRRLLHRTTRGVRSVRMGRTVSVCVRLGMVVRMEAGVEHFVTPLSAGERYTLVVFVY